MHACLQPAAANLNMIAYTLVWLEPRDDRTPPSPDHPCAPHHVTAIPNTTRSLGQNFLTDESILASIVAAANVAAGDVVLEVGPGTGNLTRFLVATGAQVCLGVQEEQGGGASM